MIESNANNKKEQLKILLLENIHQDAVSNFRDAGFLVEEVKGSLSKQELINKIKGVHILGIRSKTKVTSEIIDNANELLAIGCFCIGIDQVDHEYASKKGIIVFNSPFCNSRSVAELILCEVIALSRKLCDKSAQMHKGIWDKSAEGCYEIRGKTLGIVGYGHIGSQLSVLAESVGMNVIFYDIENKLSIGRANKCNNLEEVLGNSDFVTLHVPQTEQTKGMISYSQLETMRSGSYLLNASRGNVVDLPALVQYLKSGHLSGASIDVYPEEPESNIKDWFNVLQGLPNVILTPHIGGSTAEAQHAIGQHVSSIIIDYVKYGNTKESINFPQISMDFTPNTHRLINIHHNHPGVLKDINNILSVFNVVSQIMITKGNIGYLIADVDKQTSNQIKQDIENLGSNIKTRLLY